VPGARDADAASPGQAAPGPALPEAGPALQAGWEAQLAAWLQAHKTYPPEARRRGEEGRALLRLVVARDGEVRQADLLRRTPSRILNQSVLAFLQGARVPPFPPGMPEASLTVEVWIQWILEP
jgi:periplasmic protein TonB